MLVKQFLTKHYSSGSSDKKIVDVLKDWVKNGRNIYIVLNNNKEIEGVVTFYDILKKMIPFYLQIDDILADLAFDDLLTEEKMKEVLALNAGELMSCDVVTIKDTDNFLQAASEMFSFDFDYIPVINDKKQCVGIVSRTDLEKAILKIVHETGK